MYKATTLAILFLFVGATELVAQKTDFAWIPDSSGEIAPPYVPGLHSGARTVAGPFDLDGDGKAELLVSDYTGGGRVHILESAGVDTWELIYTSPWIDSTATTNNIRAHTGGDLDGDGMGELIAFAGRGYSPTNPFTAIAKPGIYVLEAAGDNEFVPIPSIYEFDGVGQELPDRWRTEQLTAVDIDGDGAQELLFGNNGADGRFDNWYVMSVTGNVGDGLLGTDVMVQEARWSSRASEDFDPVNRGGGSPYGMVAANLDGGSEMEIAMQSWNNYNFTNARATGPDTYVAPGAGDADGFYQAATSDHVAFFGCVAVDMDANGDDEVYCPRLQTGNGALLNYEDGEDALKVTADNVVLDILPGFSTLGITAGDIDKDGVPELIGSGSSYTHGAFAAGNPPAWINIADFAGGDVEDPANYTILPVPFPEDMRDAFDTVHRDSAGVMTTYMENGVQGPEFAGKLAYLGDPDDDGFNEVAFSMQGVDDTLYVYDEVFDPADSSYTRTVRSATANEARVFLRVVSSDGIFTNITEERVVVPSDYVLEANYPNPFNPTTTFSFTLPLDKHISVRIYDMAGRLVRTLVNKEWYAAGTHQATWNGLTNSGVQAASGSYIYALEYGNYRQARTMQLIK